MITHTIHVGDCIPSQINRMIIKANEEDDVVVATFSGVDVAVRPGDKQRDIYRYYFAAKSRKDKKQERRLYASLDGIQKEAEKLLDLLKNRQPKNADWSGWLPVRLHNMQALIGVALKQ